MINRKRETQSYLKPILWIGVTLFLISIASLLLLQAFGYSYKKYDSLDESGFSIAIAYSPLIMLVIYVIVIPIIEELSFRFWTIKKKYAYVTSLIIAPIFLYISTHSIIFSVVVLGLFVLLFFFVKKNELLLILVTSFMFSVAHIGRFSEINISVIIVLIQIFSTSLIICYFALQYHFIFAIAIHCLINLFSTSLMFSKYQEVCQNLQFYNNVQTSVSDYDYTMALKPITSDNNIIDCSNDENRFISFQGQLSNFIYEIQLLDTNKTIKAFYKIEKETNKSLPNYNIASIWNENVEVNYNNLLYNTLKSARLTCDTSYQKTYCLRMLEHEKIIADNDCEEISLYGLAIKIQTHYDIPVSIPNNVNENYPICINENLFDKCKTIENLITELKRTYGIEMKTMPNCKKMIIEFRKH